MDPTRIEDHERLQVGDRHDHGTGVELEEPRAEYAGDGVQVVGHRAIRPRADDDEFVADRHGELPRHLVPDNRFVSAGGRKAALHKGIEEPGQRDLALRVDTQ